MRKMFTDCGYEIEKITARRAVGWKSVLATALTLGVAWPFLAFQYLIVARPRASK
jgi:hypothetical protein